MLGDHKKPSESAMLSERPVEPSCSRAAKVNNCQEDYSNCHPPVDTKFEATLGTTWKRGVGGQERVRKPRLQTEQ